MTLYHFLVLIVLIWPASLQAEEIVVEPLMPIEQNTNDLEAYTPPPMFNTPEPKFTEPDREVTVFDVQIKKKNVAETQQSQKIKKRTSPIAIKPRRRPSVVKASPEFLQNIEHHQAQKAKDIPVPYTGYIDEGNLDKQIADTSIDDILRQIDPDYEAASSAVVPTPSTSIVSRDHFKRVEADLNESDIRPNTLTINFRPELLEQKMTIDSNFIKDVLFKTSLNNDLNLEIYSYSGTRFLSVGEARALSYLRGKAMRDLLVQYNISPEKITIRALSDRSKKEDADRIEIIFRKILG